MDENNTGMKNGLERQEVRPNSTDEMQQKVHIDDENICGDADKYKSGSAPIYEFLTAEGENLICPRCGKEFAPKASRCPYCGLKNEMKRCESCGATIAKSTKICPKCGAKNKKSRAQLVRLLTAILTTILVLVVGKMAIGGSDDKTIRSSTSSAVSQENSVEEIGDSSGVISATKEDEKTNIVKNTPTPNPNATVKGGGYMITIDSEDKPLLGTWEAYCYYDTSDETMTFVEEAPEQLYFKIVINSDNTGKMYGTYGSSLYHGFEWEYIGTTDDGTRAYRTLETDREQARFSVIDKKSDLGAEFGGMLAMSYSDLLIFFEKK